MSDKKQEIPVPKLIGSPVRLAFLKDSVSVPGTRLVNDLTLLNGAAKNTKHPGLVMHYDGANLICHLEGRKIIIPGANIRGLEME